MSCKSFFIPTTFKHKHTVGQNRKDLLLTMLSHAYKYRRGKQLSGYAYLWINAFEKISGRQLPWCNTVHWRAISKPHMYFCQFLQTVKVIVGCITRLPEGDVDINGLLCFSIPRRVLFLQISSSLWYSWARMKALL